MKKPFGWITHTLGIDHAEGAWISLQEYLSGHFTISPEQGISPDELERLADPGRAVAQR